MALLISSEDKLEYPYQEAEEYVCLPSNGSAEQEEGEEDVEDEEYVSLPSHGSTKQEEEEEMDEEHQVLNEGSAWSPL